MKLVVYLAGEIHTEWRREIKEKAQELQLPLEFVGPMENHEYSDVIGEKVMGTQPGSIHRDEAASRVNNLRTQVLLSKADLVIALFGDKYRQWNTAMDASAALAQGKPVILIRAEELHHPLKELSQKANLTVETVEQAVQAISYIFES